MDVGKDDVYTTKRQSTEAHTENYTQLSPTKRLKKAVRESMLPTTEETTSTTGLTGRGSYCSATGQPADQCNCLLTGYLTIDVSGEIYQNNSRIKPFWDPNRNETSYTNLVRGVKIKEPMAS